MEIRILFDNIMRVFALINPTITVHLSHKLGEGVLVCILFFGRVLTLFFEISLRNNCQHLLSFTPFHVVLLVQVALYGVNLPLQIG